MMGKKWEKDGYFYFYEGDEIDYSDPVERESIDEAIERLRGTIAMGTCVFCGGVNTMKCTDDNMFVCSACGKAVSEDTYCMWAAGYDIGTDFEGEDYDELYDDGTADYRKEQ